MEGILAWHLLHYDRALLQKFPKCKVLVRVGIGIDSVDLKYSIYFKVYRRIRKDLCQVQRLETDQGSKLVELESESASARVEKGVSRFRL